MKYALLGDLHSQIKDTKKVLKAIRSERENVNQNLQIIGLGDLFECKVGKKKLATLQGHIPLTEAADYTVEFIELLTFPSIIGNQEERIALVTGDKHFLSYPEKMEINHATLMHGHQFKVTEPFELTIPPFETPLLFFGHSHRSALYCNGVRTEIEFDLLYKLNKTEQYAINVGSVVENREWCLYDSEEMTVTFKKARTI